MRHKTLPLLRHITTSPSVNVVVGVIFLATGLTEAWTAIEDMTIGAHHGAIVFGLLHILKYFPDLIEGLEYMQKSEHN
jgi:hypothetical protein